MEDCSGLNECQKTFRRLIRLGQTEYCAQGRLKLAVYKRESEQDNVESALDGELETSRLLNDPEHFDKALDTKMDRNQSLWVRYRFLFIPGILGLITLIGIQSLICALWKRRLSHRDQSRRARLLWRWDSSCFCSHANHNCFNFRGSLATPDFKSTPTYSNECNTDSSERSRTKRVEFISDNNISSSKSHSHMGIGTMPKHLISQSVNKQNYVPRFDPNIPRDRLQKNRLMHPEQSAMYYNNEHAHDQANNGRIPKTECVKKVQRCCTDGEKGTGVANAQACIFMDDCATYIVPLSTVTFTEADIVLDKIQQFDDQKVIHISV